MGGAYVAMADDLSAVYWNPAGLGIAPPRGVMVSVSAAGSDRKDTINNVESLVDMNLAASGRIITPGDISKAIDLLETLAEKGNGVTGEANANFIFKYDDFGFSVLTLGNAAAIPIINLDILNFDPYSGQPLPTDLPKLNFSGVIAREFIGSYTHSIIENTLWAGVNAKYIQADTYYSSRLIVDPNNKKLRLRDLVNEAKGPNKRSTSKFGLDLGIMGIVAENLRIGVVARDVTGPTLESAGLVKVKMNPQYRMGVSYAILPALMVAADYDLSKNDEGIFGEAVREFAFGGEGRLFRRHLAIRGGMCRNVHIEGTRWQFAAGIGFDSTHVAVDVGGTTDAKSNRIGAAITGTVRF